MKAKARKSDSFPKLILEKIIGVTTKNARGLASDILAGTCVYLAGCVAVVHNVDSNTQSYFMVSSRPPKPLSCVAVSRGGAAYIAVGESGSQPGVLVWDRFTQTLVAELKGHRFGVASIDFSPDGKHLVSAGFPHDGYLCLWDWTTGRLVTKLKVSTSCSAIFSVTFASDGAYLVTAGKKHLKYWAVGFSTRSRSNAGASLQATDGKPVNLGSRKGDSFVSVTFSASPASNLVLSDRNTANCPIFALTDGGFLCVLSSGFSLKRWVDLKVDKGFALSASHKVIACACSNGIVRLVNADTLKSIASLQYAELVANNYNRKSFPVVPDAIACQFSTNKTLVVVYGDHSIYLWDVSDAPKVAQSCLLLAHSACVWDIVNLPCKSMHDQSLLCTARGLCPEVSFATCSEDGTVRLWDLQLQSNSEKDDSVPDALLNHSKDISLNSLKEDQLQLVSTAVFDPELVESSADALGFRTLAASLDGKYLAAGDSHGSIHVYKLDTYDYTCLQEAHAAEVLSLCFSSTADKLDAAGKKLGDICLLASGGRDQVVHIYNVKRGFGLVGSFEDHFGAVTSVKFIHHGRKILSCSADRSIVLRDVETTDEGIQVLHHHRHQVASQGAIYDMAVNSCAEVAVTVGEQKQVNFLNLSTGKLVKTLKQDTQCGEPIKVTMDPSGSYVACSYSNKSMGIYDVTTGQLIIQAMGHAEVITGVIFLPDCRHIITVGGDGCVFIWRVPALLSSIMLQKANENSAVLTPPCLSATTEASNTEADRPKIVVTENGNEETSAFKFSISKLPMWAQKKLKSEEIINGDPDVILPENIDDDASFSTIPTKFSTPCHRNLESSMDCQTTTTDGALPSNSTDVPLMGHETPRVSMERRWNTIHNVCFDLLDSPVRRDFSGFSLPVPADLREVPEDPPFCGECSSKNLDDEFNEQRRSENIVSRHFSNLSTVLKLEGRSSKRKSFSARFALHRDCLLGSKRFSEAGIANSVNEVLDCSNDDASHSSSGDLSTLFSKEQQLSDICSEDEKKCSSSSLYSCLDPAQSDATITNEITTEEIEQSHDTVKETDVQAKVAECKAALLSLDAAAEETLQLFTELKMSMAVGEDPGFPEMEISDLATNVVPSVLKKVQDLNNFVLCTKNDREGLMAKETADFEPLIQKFAERLSQQVLKLLGNSIPHD